MKRILILTAALFCLLGLAACQSSGKRVQATAEQFLNAFYAGEYGEAAVFCTPAYAARLSKVSAFQRAVPEEIAQKMKEAVNGTSFKIVSVEVDEEAGTAVVHYALTVPGVEGAVTKQLRLQLEGRTAAVDGIE